MRVETTTTVSRDGRRTSLTGATRIVTPVIVVVVVAIVAACGLEAATFARRKGLGCEHVRHILVALAPLARVGREVGTHKAKCQSQNEPHSNRPLVAQLPLPVGNVARCRRQCAA